MKILVVSDLNLMRTLMDHTFSRYDCSLVYLDYNTAEIVTALEEDNVELIIIQERDSAKDTAETLTAIMGTATVSGSPALKCLLIRNTGSFQSDELSLYKDFVMAGKLLILLPENLENNILKFFDHQRWNHHPVMAQERVTKSDFTILLVDGSSQIRQSLSDAFTEKGFELLAACDGLIGLELFEKYAPSIVITDIIIPNLSGIELCQKIKAKNRYTKVIMISSACHQETIDLACEAGADDYIVKPIDNDQLIEKVERLIDTLIVKSDYRILVVDDSLTIQENLRQEFRKNNMKVIVASNGMEGFTKAVLENSSVIITDIEMPLMNGYELLTAVKSVEMLEQTTLMMMSGRFTQANANLFVNNASIQFFAKPYDVDKLVMQTEQLVLNKSTQFRKDYENLIASISSLVCALEARDEYTRGHSERVTIYALHMGRRLGFNPQKMKTLELAAALHDLGKIGIRDDILLKPGRLNEEEFEVIKEHPALGSKIIVSIDSLQWVSKIVRHHHERYDGAGYPDGLCAKDIPMESRIISVADTFDAVTSSRPYRSAPMTFEDAKNLLTAAAGSQLCPVCVDAFIQEWDYNETLIIDAFIPHISSVFINDSVAD